MAARCEEMREFYGHFPSLRVFPGLTPTDVLGRCGCRTWVLAPGSQPGAGRPPVAAERVPGPRLVCRSCWLAARPKAAKECAL